jgi:hypothetical protein
MNDMRAKAGEIEGIQKKSEAAYAAIQSAAAETGASKHANEFGTLADSHRRFAYGWLAATALVGALTFFVVYRLVAKEQLADDARNGVIARFVILRATVFALLSYMTVWTSRNYRAHRHLDVLNRHRAKALATFETFASSAKDEATKNAVLLETTRCIFNAGATAYAADESEGSTVPIIEIVKSFVERGK